MKRFWMMIVGGLALTGFGCASDGAGHHGANARGAGHTQAWKSVEKLVAVIKSTQGNTCTGVVVFTKVPEGVEVSATVSGLKPNAKHGFHIHEFGDATKSDGASAGGHFNPESHPHALAEGAPRHAGDLGNLEANGQGVANYKRLLANVSLTGLRNPIIGRGVIVHVNPDDGSQPTGNAGPRIGIGVIGIANVPAPAPVPAPAK